MIESVLCATEEESLVPAQQTTENKSVAAPSPSPATSPAAHGTVNRDNPLYAQVVDRKLLTTDESTKTTVHIAFSLAGSGLSYEAGDSCGVLPKNSEWLVSKILNELNYSGQEMVECGNSGPISLHDALTTQLQINRLTRRTVSDYAKLTGMATLEDLLKPEQKEHLETYLHGRDLLDLLMEYPAELASPSDLVATLPRLTPRLYSISSSPAAHKDEVHLTVAVVNYRTHGRERGGVCSTYLGDQLQVGEKAHIFIHSNKRFRIPSDPKAPMIMIGPGTGIAPFRSFLHERRALGHIGRNWLFFGERSSAGDFLYKDELHAMLSDGSLSRLDTAFSRDQLTKVYVQDRMRECSAELWKWLNEGAGVYVCGDAKQMARDVHQALCDVVAKEGNLSTEEANVWVEDLKLAGRYHRDVY